MDYYYALLDSYQLLKRRKFKLSLKEQEEEAVDPEAKAKAISAFSSPEPFDSGRYSTANSGGPLYIYKKDPASPTTTVVGGPLGSHSGGSAATFDGLPPKTQSILIKHFAEDDPQAGEQAVLSSQAQQYATDLDKLISGTDTIEGLSSQLEEFFPGYDENKRRTRWGSLLNRIRDKLGGRRGSLGIRGEAGQDPSITDRLLASPNLGPDKSENALDAANTLLMNVIKAKSDGNILESDLRKLSQNIELSPEGVLFGPPGEGVFLQYRSSGASPKNDLFYNATEQINKQIRKYNENNCGPNLPPDKYKTCSIREIPEPSHSGRALSLRGSMMEYATVLTDLADAYNQAGCDQPKPHPRCKEIGSRLGTAYQGALDLGTGEEIQEMFTDGLGILGGEIIASLRHGGNAQVTQQVLDFLVDERGMEPHTAAVLVDRASKMPDKGSRALILLVASSRGFTRYTKPLEMVDSKVVAQEGSQFKGAKDDVERTVSTESFNKWKEEIKNKQSKLEKELEKAAGCAGAGVGIDNLGSDNGDGTTTFGTEIKSRTSLGRGRTKTGEGKTSRMSSICAGDEGDAEEQSFITTNSQRIQNCAKGTPLEKALGGKSVFEAACSFQRTVDSDMAPIRAALKGQTQDEDGKAVPHSGTEVINTWLDTPSRSNIPEAKERARLATDGLAVLKSGSMPTKEQREALSKIEESVVQDKIAAKLYEGSEDGVLQGEALAYFVTRTGLEGGSMHESLKDVRGYSDSQQRLGTINTSTYGIISMLMSGKASASTSKEGSRTFSIKTTHSEDGELSLKTLGRGSLERGQFVSSITNDTMSPVEKGEVELDTNQMLLKFLHGQQKLVEKLLSQTT